MQEHHPVAQAVAALIRREDEVLLVRQQGPHDLAPSWALPGGMVEAGELLTEALAREVREETGLEVLTPGRLLYLMQLDNPHKQQLRQMPGPEPSYQSTAFVFEIGAWKGELGAADPDGIVLEPRFLPQPEAIHKLEELPMRIMSEPIVAYLRGETGAGTVWLYRRQGDGSDELVGRLDIPKA